MDPNPLLTLENVSKSFGPVNVIKDVSVEVRPGRVQALLGENGAGKSTLIKMMAGIHQPDAGRVLIDGEPVSLSSVKAAEAHGIATIHQELNLFPNMTVAENISMGRMPASGGILRRNALRDTAERALARLGLSIDPDHMIGDLGVARQQLVEIAKALSLNARILILDEPTATLTESETNQLFAVVNELRGSGVAMVFISHHLEEISRIGDSVSVLRDGSLVSEVSADTEEDELVRLMVGRSIENQYPRRRDFTGEQQPLLQVERLSRSGILRDISFDAHAGEVVGIAGLVGAGRTELIRSIAGADPYDNGTVTVRGRQLPRKDIAAAIAAGIGHVPEDRKSHGLVLGASVTENLNYATLRAQAKAGIVSHRRQRRNATGITEKLRVRMRDIDQEVRDLSGGNQQKIVFGRWILADSEVLLLDEPTRGVDVGARVEIYEFINEVTARGGTVVMVSSDLPEVLGMSDRILVMSGGSVAGELNAEEATQDAVMSLAVRDVDREAEDLAQASPTSEGAH